MSYAVIKDLKEKRGAAISQSADIRATANKENRDLTADEATRHDALLAEVETYNTRIAREEKAGALSELIQNQTRSLIGRETPSNSVAMPHKDFKRYSLLRAIRMTLRGQALDGVEGEVNAELAKRMGRQSKGFYMPYDMRTLNAASTGAGSIETTTESTFIDILRAKTVTGKVGTTFLTDLQGKIAIPQKTATAAGYWVGEGASPTAGQPTLSQVLFTPKTLGGFTDITRQLAEQTSLDAEALVIDDLTKSLGVSLDIAAFVGTGSSNQPQGIVGTSGVNTIAMGTNGGDPTFNTYVAMETAVAAANADLGEMSYVITPAQRGYLKTLAKNASAVAAGFVYEDNEINGYSAYATNVLPSNGTKGTGTNLSTSVFGNFNDLVIGMWGGLDVMVDPYTGSSSGTVRIVALQDADIELRHAASFTVITDLLSV